VDWILAYTGSNARVLDYKRRWTGQDVQRILTRSTNADWDDLFQDSGYVVPWAGVRLHDQGASNYLAISPDAAVRAGTAQGSFHNMGRRISGSGAHGTTLRNRCTAILTALEAATPPAATLALEGGPPPASQLTWDGATPEQLAFKRRVYETQVSRAGRGRRFVANVPKGELDTIEGGHQARTAVAEACRRLLADARAAGGADRAAIASAYRSVARQFANWNGNFARYYGQTAAARAKAPGGEHGEQAAELLARHIGGILAAPGYSLHNDGRAIDFRTRHDGQTLGPSTKQRKAWRDSWLFQWLSEHAAGYGFHQNLSIDEPWHWEHRAHAGAAQALGVIAAGEADVASVPLLSEHHDAGPDMILRWNEIADLSSGIDVVVHLHGFSSDRHLDLRRRKLPISGLDFAPPAPTAGMPRQPSWTGRRRPTLLVLPRGRARPGHNAAYDFPALVRVGAFAQLVDVALREFEARAGVGRRLEPRRIILTAHSGGGASLNRILGRTEGTPVDPHEVHVFDGLYGADAPGLRTWVERRLRRDVARLRAGVPDAAAYMATEGCALRTLYLHGSDRATTRPASLKVQADVDALIPAGTPYTALLKRHYRTEVARVGHMAVPYWYGGRLLVDVAADIAGP
jgi:LAS superfamily LD-carboxypeptidase LdcB